MSEPGLIDKLVGEDYRECYRIASEMYSDEQARQACCATLMIQYTQLRKSNVKLAEALRMLDEARAEYKEAMSRQATPFQIVRWFYQPLVDVYPKAKGMLDHLESQGITDFNEVSARMVEWMYRNGLEYGMRCDLRFNSDSIQTTTDGRMNEGCVDYDLPTDD